MKKTIWLVNRLKAMSISEIIYRGDKKLLEKKNKLRYKKSIKCEQIFKKDIDIDLVYKKTNRIFCNPNDIKNLKKDNLYSSFLGNVNIMKKIYWHKGNKKNWDKNKYSLDIYTKFSDDIGDVRCSWEINRQQFLPYLSLIYIKYNDKNVYSLIEKHFYDWSNDNNFLRGINWISPMEIAIRSYQWLITFHILGEKAEKKFREDLIKAIVTSINYVNKNLSKYSSANNHLILETFIMSVVGYCLEDVYKQNWFEEGYKILSNEFYKQNYQDGINKEHALHYQAFVTDALLQYNIILKKIDKAPMHENIIRNSLIFMGSLNINKLNFDYGDSDDAKIISFNNKNYYEYLLQLGSLYYNKKFIKFDQVVPEVTFFYGKKVINNIQDFKYNEFKLYKEGGYFTISNKNNKVLIDVAELGFGTIAAHGHADALSLIYYKNENPIIIDSGTYVYNIEEKMRNYFRSTEAHNTLSYNKLNQSQIKGPFLWGKKANVEIVEYINSEDFIRLIAKHDGYKPFIHTREFEYCKKTSDILIKDYFDKEATINFILDNEAKVNNIKSNIVQIIIKDSIVYFKSNYDIEIKETIISKKFTEKIKSKKISIKGDFVKYNYIETKISNKL